MGMFDFLSNTFRTKSLIKLRKDGLALKRSHQLFSDAIANIKKDKRGADKIVPISKDFCRRTIFVQNDILWGYHKLQGQFNSLIKVYQIYDFNKVMSNSLSELNKVIVDKLEEYKILSRDIARREHAKRRDVVRGFFGEKSEHYQERSERKDSKDSVVQYKHIEDHIEKIKKIMEYRITLVKRHGISNDADLKAEIEALKVSFEIEIKETEEIFKQSVAWAFEIKNELSTIISNSEYVISEDNKREIENIIETLEVREERERRISRKFERVAA